MNWRKQVENITTTQARSICISILKKDTTKMTETEMKTTARKFLRGRKQTPSEALESTVQKYAKSYGTRKV